MHFSLRIKSSLVGTPLEPLALAGRHFFHMESRWRCPELAELHNEARWIAKALVKILRPSSNCVDVGCHIGSFLSAIIRCSPNGSHTAFEPVAEKAARLSSKFPQVRVIASAVSEQSGRARFQEDHERPGFSKLSEAGNIDVAVTTLDHEISHKVDLIKIDAEGGELGVLRGARQTVLMYRPTLIFECGADFDLSVGYRQALFEIITSNGYQIQTPSDFVFGKGAMDFSEFRRCGIYPFRAFNFVATPHA